MKCQKCNNSEKFVLFFNHSAEIVFRNSNVLPKIKENLDIPDIFPVICGKCNSEQVDFQYSEIEKLMVSL